jgi:DNA mismatch repair protein MutS2
LTAWLPGRFIYFDVDNRTLEILELPKVLERLASHASFSLGKTRALGLRPTNDRIEAERRQTLTDEARRLVELNPHVTIGGARDVGDHVRRAGLGGRLEPSDLLDVAATLEAMRNLRRAILPHRERVEHLAELAAGLADLRSIEDAVGGAIDANGTVMDSASPALGHVRREVRIAHSRLMDKLNSMLTSSAYADVIQDAIITVRDGRYVIPIKAEARGKLRAIVHDQSSSGATLFVEPLLTVDLNNRWRELQLEEEREVERILQELSHRIAAEADALLFGLDRLADIDLALACARYAAQIRAVQPRLVEGQGRDPEAEIRLTNARHPLPGSCRSLCA